MCALSGSDQIINATHLYIGVKSLIVLQNQSLLLFKYMGDVCYSLCPEKKSLFSGNKLSTSGNK